MGELLLGIHGGANATAAIAVDGHLTYCVQEERLTGIKGYMGFPRRAIATCLDAAGADAADVAEVVYGSRSGAVEHCPRDEWRRRLTGFHHRPDLADMEAHLVAASPNGLPQRLDDLLRQSGVTARVTYIDHHTAHAAAAYYGLRAAPERPYLVLTCDGFGDGTCATVSTWTAGHRIEIARTDMRDSIGLLWFWFTHAAGFTPHEDEYKLMGMAPYARADRAREVADILHESLGLDRSGLRLRRSTGPSIERAWPAIEQRLHGRRFDDQFAGLQLFTEELLTRWVSNAVAATGIPDVLVGGGVFMNIKVNQRIAALDCVRTFNAFPSCGDESLPLGALYHHLAATHGHQTITPLSDCYLGEEITPTDARDAVAGTGLVLHEIDQIEDVVAQLLADGEIVARCAGRMEFGARALGNRSILANPSDADIPRRLNRLIKQRDFWMPFAPAMLRSHQHRYIHNPRDLHSPYMMIGFDTPPDAATHMIAAMHPADLSCRPQIVDDHSPTGLAAILDAYHHRTGQAVLLNTSLNLHGQPIARTAVDAVNVLLHSDLAHLQLGPYLVTKHAPTC
ncbi:carbamoyltransferase C-terminal domain-containing protein [Micromonospora yangpuensis]|uniref:Carbamoyltransferase n=1 Tax=Micromonospora yangpuensis TaxID=683228 RepID=A0A1C6U483_9ACTN|nr:carbamoyltransferase C-terminal domain-containing protein [Micromonospora yangpuensis]GGL93263.1 carbamoyltransferase [Micromonospora yangpuensis]SCL48679.1 carbamoyltransferase [Micromonospora yangpuensis]